MDNPQKNSNDSTQLMSEFQQLSTFAQVKDWGKRAGKELDRIAGLLRAYDLDLARDAQELERLKFENSKKPLVGRLFGGGSNKEEKELNDRLEEHRQAKTELAKMSAQLQEAIDFTPATPEQQKRLLQELRQHKKEVQEKKREITSVIRTARPAIQQQPEEEIFDPATLKRRKARYARDAEVQINETSKTASERQLAQIERDIQWAEKFHQ